MIVRILYRGYRIVTGQSRDSLMGLVVSSLRAVLIVGVATSMAAGGSQMYWALTDGLGKAIIGVVADESDPYESIDKNLAIMTASMAAIDALQDEQEETVKDDKDRAIWFTGIGIAGPAVIASSLLLLNKIAMALFVGFGPLFVLSLLFEQTKGMFSRWLFYGIGTAFSLGVLTVMVSLATKVVGAVALAFLAKYAASGFTGGGEGVNSMALQQGGLGLVMSTLIVMAPPMAAAFFQGTLANFVAQSSFGQIGRNSTGQTNDTRQPMARSDGSDFGGRLNNKGEDRAQNKQLTGGGPLNNPYANNSAQGNSPRAKYES
nr:type IV secretion system protein [Pseudoxanthomonas sacheonensis]